ncbi:PD-(D/E)XK nuclease family protein [Halorussus limi]|uniref:PD-(D/E)XK nuclease family protein n=2 Tax=Halorussus TaxID=1070314 RepID=A0A8U0IFT3_9EURY|nr:MULTISPECIES: PD-(D/E)XK nuclease family protein [Halorussus]UPV73927.1 PD-(D/E)XK nuclease family protein [Halorussus limi]UPV99946.1 PD-(D/E)XK nuclease family protein [Halorussus gelatinilyticus]
MTRSIEAELAAVRQRLAALPEAEEPPPTTLQVLGRSTQERDWQQFLVHFLTPDAPHGLNHALLEHVLAALSDRDDLEYEFSRFDIDDIQIAQEVATSDGIPDVVLWASDEWFICWELKVHASEGDDQTPRYVGVDSFDGIGLDKSEVPVDGQHYVFLAPESASSPDAEEFVHVSWEWLAAELQSFLVESYDEYPARTTAQLKDFVDTIRSELTMTEYQENQHEMVELYVENYGVISDLEAAFEEEWSEFEEIWGTRLAQTLDAAELLDDPDVPDEYAAVELEMATGERRQWTFRQGTSDWAWLFPREWWRKVDEDRPVSDAIKPNARVGFLHRLERNREDAVRDHTLVVYVRNAPSGHEDFYNGFADRFSNTQSEISDAINGTKLTITGNKSNVLRAEYEIDVDRHDDFFEAYLDALSRAVKEGVLSNPELIETIDRLYETTITDDVSV